MAPTEVAALRGEEVVAVAAGGGHTVVATASGAVWTFGEGEDGELGHGDGERCAEPRRVDALAGLRATALAAGAYHTAVVAGGVLHTFGWGESGRLGHGDFEDRLVPEEVAALRSVPPLV
jgi:regulator of chromosome condensation